MTRCSKFLSRILFMQSYNVKYISLCKIFGCPIGFYPSSPITPFSLFHLSFLLFIPPFLLFFPPSNRLSSLIRLPPAGPHLPPPLGGSLHSMTSPVCPPSKAAWLVPPSSAADELKHFRPSIYCHSFSHDRWPFIPISMSPPCLDFPHCNVLDFGHGSPGSVNFLLNVVAGVGGGRLLGIPWHGLPLIRAFVKECLALSAFSLCQCSYPSAAWDIDSHIDSSPSRADRQDKVLGCLCSSWKNDALGTLSCSDNLSVSALQQEISDLWSVYSVRWGENQDI